MEFSVEKREGLLELTAEQAAKLIHVLEFVSKIRKRKSVILDNSGEFLRKAVKFYLEQKINSETDKQK